jgi:hypothetical protein
VKAIENEELAIYYALKYTEKWDEEGKAFEFDQKL